MQEKIIQNQKSDTETGDVKRLDNESTQQLTIEIATAGQPTGGNEYATITNHVFPYYINMNQTSDQSMYSPTMTQTESSAYVSNYVRPDMYIMNESKLTNSSSDEESDRSVGSGETPRISVSSEDENSSIGSTNSSDSLDLGMITKRTTSKDSSRENKSKTKITKIKMRTNYTPDQVKTLEKVFVEIPYPDAAEIESLSKDLDIAETKLKIWFQNKRARFRRRTQVKPQQNFISPLDSIMPQMGPYGVIPQHHPMLHGSPAGMPPPYFYQGYPFGMPLQPPTQGLHGQPITPRKYLSTSNQQTTTPSPNISTSLSLSSSSPVSSTTSPNTSETGSPQSPQTVSPFHHNLTHVQPYMPFSYPYGMFPPYYC